LFLEGSKYKVVSSVNVCCTSRKLCRQWMCAALQESCVVSECVLHLRKAVSSVNVCCTWGKPCRQWQFTVYWLPLHVQVISKLMTTLR